jgi:hypothetical protein
MYARGERITSYETWSSIREAYVTIRKAGTRRSHGGRLKALAKVCA